MQDGPLTFKLDEVGYGSKIWINNMSLNFAFIVYWLGMLVILLIVKLIIKLTFPKKLKKSSYRYRFARMVHQKYKQ